MTEAADKEKLIADAWKRWREVDYSWEGLARLGADGAPFHKWNGWQIILESGVELAVEASTGRRFGMSRPDPLPSSGGIKGRPASLQDYWRADSSSGFLRSDADLKGGGFLVEMPGQPTYHAVHLPLTYADGSPTIKATASPDILDALTHARLSIPDTMARFDGGVWKRGPRRSDVQLVHIDYGNSIFVESFDLTNAIFNRRVSFRQAIFFGDLILRGCQFDGGTSFSRSVFIEKAIFDFVIFKGPAGFNLSIFCGSAEFASAIFSDYAYFSRVMFFSGAVFDRSIFNKAANFESTQFIEKATFDRAVFNGDANFHGFDGFDERKNFFNDAIFSDVVFEGLTDFTLSAFSGIADFSNCVFRANVLFRYAEFFEPAKYLRSTFSSQALFEDIKVRHSIDFSGAKFVDLASFRSRLSKPDLNNRDQVSPGWPNDAKTWHGMFSSATFNGPLDLTNIGFGRFAAFDNAIIENNIIIDVVSESVARLRFRREIEDAYRDPATRDENTTPGIWREERLVQLERGCRVLKQQMERQSDKQREQLLYKFELLARRAQSKLRLGEKSFSYLYDWAADYGASIIRPFLSLAIVIVAFSAIFVGLALAIGCVGTAHGQVDPERAAAQALNFSLSNSFKPLSALSADAGIAGTIVDRLLNQNVWLGIVVRMVSILQSLLSVTLAFLFGLSVRRRFQIN